MSNSKYWSDSPVAPTDITSLRDATNNILQGKYDTQANIDDIDPITSNYLKDNEIHSSDCSYWVNEPCNCIARAIDFYDMRDDG